MSAIFSLGSAIEIVRTPARRQASAYLSGSRKPPKLESKREMLFAAAAWRRLSDPAATYQLRQQRPRAGIAG
jgi:hypothetical protein